MCKNEKRTHGTAATGVPVAEMLASEARRDRTRVDAQSAYNDPSLCLFPGDRSRESCGTWQLPQIIISKLAKTRKVLTFLRLFKGKLKGSYKEQLGKHEQIRGSLS